MPGSSESEEASDASTSHPRRRTVVAADQPTFIGEARFGRDEGTDGDTGRAFDLWRNCEAETARWTFGLEFEFAEADCAWVALELHARGLTATAAPVPYHSTRSPGLWAVEYDSTVTTMFHEAGDPVPAVAIGGEVVSPPLSDTPEAWAQIEAVLAVLRGCGAEVNGQCGFHVHFGASALRAGDADLRGGMHSFVARVTRLAVLANACFEDVLFRMASAEGGRHRGRPFFYRHSRPLEQTLEATYDTVDALAQVLGKPGAPRRAALNLTNVGTPDKDTVEFRQSNGTLDLRVVRGFVRLCAALIGGARWAPEAVAVSPEPLGTHHGRGGDDTTVPLWRLMRAVCPEGLPVDAVASLLWLYRRGAWQPGLADLVREG